MPKWNLPRILDDVAALRAMTKHVELQAVKILVGADVKEYWFSEIAMDADDGDLFIKPTDIAVDDPGRWVLMAKTNATGGGSSEGSTLSDYEGSLADLEDDETRDFVLSPVAGQTEVAAGVLMRLEISAPASPGMYLVELYRDAARTDLFAAYDIDTSIQPFSTLAVGYIADDEEDPDVYGRITNLSGGEADVDIDAQFGVIAAVNGLVVNQVAPSLAANPGLELQASALRIKAFTGLLRDANGLSVDPATVPLLGGGLQTFTSHKRFASIGLVPSGSSGPPVGGTWALGDLVLDNGGRIWRCVEAGEPGKWELFQGPGATWFSTYAGSPDPDIAPETSYDGILDISGRRCQLVGLRVGVYSNLAVAYDFPFRLEFFSKETRLAADALCPPLHGVARKVETSGSNAAGQAALNVNSVGSIFAGDLVYLIKADLSGAEFGRVAARPSGTQFTMGDDLIATFADDSHVVYFNEFGTLTLENDTDTVLDQQKIFWRFHHDGKAADGDPDIEKLYFSAKVIDLPGGMLG